MKSRLVSSVLLHLSVHFVHLKQVLSTQTVICTKGGYECVFPFTYGGSEYTNCISGVRGAWCGIRPNVTVNRMGVDYDYCTKKCPLTNVVRCTKDGYKCQFPFFHAGQNHSRCIKTYSFLFDKAPWCGITADGTVIGTCAKQCPEKGAMIWTTTTTEATTTERMLTETTLTPLNENATTKSTTTPSHTIRTRKSGHSTAQNEILSSSNYGSPSNVTIQDAVETFSSADPTLVRNHAPSSNASSVGVGIAIAVALLILFGLAAYVLQKRRQKLKKENVEENDKGTEAAIPLRETIIDDHIDNNTSSPDKTLVAEETKVPMVACVVNGDSKLSN